MLLGPHDRRAIGHIVGGQHVGPIGVPADPGAPPVAGLEPLSEEDLNSEPRSSAWNGGREALVVPIASAQFTAVHD